MTRLNPRSQAFTLVELLVVIGIIALLIGILLPSLIRAQSQAKGVVCRSNLRQIAIAAQMYAQDNKVYIGYLGAPVNRDRKSGLYPYLKQGKDNTDTSVRQVWHCPMNRQPDVEASYGFNANLNHTKIARIRRWSETVAIADGGILDTRLPTTITHLWPPSRMSAPQVRPNPRHTNKMVNVAMTDGHVEAWPMIEPFYPGPAGVWTGNGVINAADPQYKDQMWDLR